MIEKEKGCENMMIQFLAENESKKAYYWQNIIFDLNFFIKNKFENFQNNISTRSLAENFNKINFISISFLHPHSIIHAVF